MTHEDFDSLKKELSSNGVTLVAVSKTRSPEKILELYNFGQRDFGENYVQELTEKQPQLPGDIRWHFIGHLQRNKVKFIAPFIALIQSVDSEKLLREIDKEAKKNERTIDVLLQVHIADEDTKFGWDAGEIKAVLPKLSKFQNVRVKGLMGMASFSDDKEKVTSEFSDLHNLFLDCQKETDISWDTLSMGMSADYEMAIASGSTMVRIGSLLFGKRD